MFNTCTGETEEMSVLLVELPALGRTVSSIMICNMITIYYSRKRFRERFNPKKITIYYLRLRERFSQRRRRGNEDRNVYIFTIALYIYIWQHDFEEIFTGNAAWTPLAALTRPKLYWTVTTV